MNSLLIYNTNIGSKLFLGFNETLGESYFFQIGKQELLSRDFSVDSKISEILQTKIERKKYDAIFIPYSLSEENYLEFIGLRFACHIRLSPEFNNLQTPIIFYGFEQADEINKLSDLGSILFTKNTYQTSKVSIQDFSKQVGFVKKNAPTISDNEFVKAFVQKVQIKSSGNYATHHSIANEWSIYRWAKALKIDNEVIKKIDAKIGSALNFKYLKLKYPIKKNEDLSKERLTPKGRILYIDDELEKGWDVIFEKICEGNEFESFGLNFKNWSPTEILDESIKKVTEVKPDVVILDFRLHDDDFEMSNPTEIIGFKVLEAIKKINRGIQVIIFSATNKIWNLQALQKAGADGFVIKESPENSIDKNFTNHAITSIYKTTNACLGMAFLKDVQDKILSISAFLKKQSANGKNTQILDFYKRIENNIEIGYYTLKQYTEHKKFINFSYLTFFQIIEDFANYYFEEGEECYVKLLESRSALVMKTSLSETRNTRKREYTSCLKFNEENRYYQINNSTHLGVVDLNCKMSNILIYRYGFDNSNQLKWKDLNNYRNTKAAHFNKNSIISKDDLISLLDLLIYIINDKNVSEKNYDKSLPIDFNNLLDKFNK